MWIDKETFEYIFWITLTLSLTLGPWIASLLGGHFYQKSKKKKLLEREINSPRDPITNLRKPSRDDAITSSKLVWANVVMSPSWWQILVGKISSMFGGRIDVLTNTFDWARREVLQRLREKAWDEGYDDVINLRIDTSMISANTEKQAAMEIIAYGTGIRY